jgi:hypothetical protein
MFNWLRRFFGGGSGRRRRRRGRGRLDRIYAMQPADVRSRPRGPGFSLVQVETRELGCEQGSKYGVFLAANLDSPQALEALVAELVDKFKLQRTISPPETSLMLITVIGSCDVPRFLELWRTSTAEDPIAKVYLSMMEKADLGHSASRDGSNYTFHSLLPQA